jgi:hypothetical protein
MDEINAAFAAIDTKATTAADLQVEARQTGAAITINPDGTTTKAQGDVAPAVVADVAPDAPVDSAPVEPAVPADPAYN